MKEAAKLDVLKDLVKQMQELMASGDGDEEMDAEDVSGAIEEAGEGPEADSGMSLTEACSEDDGESDPLAEEKKKFMRGMVDRPQRKSLNIMPKKPVVAISVEKKVAAVPKKKAKGKY